MAADSILVRDGVAMGINVSVVNLVDRPGVMPVQPSSVDISTPSRGGALGNGFLQQTGAVYRLLQRSGVRGHSLLLKKASIQQGLVTQDEFDWMYNHLTT